MTPIQEAITRARAYMENGTELSAAKSITDAFRIEMSRVLSDLHMTDPNFYEDGVIHYTGLSKLFSLIHKKDKSDDDSNSTGDGSTEHDSTSEDTDYFRLYDTLHANDPDEGLYLIRNWPEETNWIWKNTDPAKDNFSSPAATPNFHDYAYYISFVRASCTKDMADNLVFWRTYGKEGEGCAIQIPLTQFRLRNNAHNPDSHDKLPLYHVLYGREGVSHLAREVTESLKQIKQALAQHMPSIEESVVGTIRQDMNIFKYLYKSDAYDYEHECRLVIPRIIVVPSDVQFEESSDNFGCSQIRHYLLRDETRTSKFLVSNSSIVIGPCVKQVPNVLSFIKTMLDRRKLHGPTIRTSMIQYRRN